MEADTKFFEEDKIETSSDSGLLKLIYPFTKPYLLLLFLSIFFISLITILDLSIPYITKIAIDKYIIPDNNPEKITSSLKPDDKKRVLKIDMRNHAAKEIVEKYSALFIIKSDHALLPYHSINKINEKDLRTLREDQIKGLGIIALFLALIIFFSFIFNFIQVMIMEYLGQIIMHDMRMKIFSHIKSMPVSYFTKNPLGRLVTRATNDVTNMQEMFTSILTFIFKDLFMLLGIIFLLLYINYKPAIISFIIIPFVAFTSITFAKRSRNVFRTLRIKIAEINSRFSETISGIKIIQIFKQENNNYQKFKKLNHENYTAGMEQVHIFAIFMPAIEIMGYITLAIIIYYGGNKVLNQTLSLGVLVAFISYMKMFFRPVRDIAEKYNQLQNALASAERIFLVLHNRKDLPEKIKKSNPNAIPLEKIETITFDNISFSYNDEKKVLDNISFSIKSGETLTIVGETGSGKTSLINLIIRFNDPTNGSILINHKNINEYHLFSLRSRIALVMQDPFLFSGSIRNNIIGDNKNISEKQFEQILLHSNSKSFIKRLPDGADTELNEEGHSLSSGERQLLSIARALAYDPDLIILDEATSYIDSESESKIQEALSNLMKNRTAIIIAHRLSTARSANQIIVLHNGKIIEKGTHKTLINNKGFYYNLNMIH